MPEAERRTTDPDAPYGEQTKQQQFQQEAATAGPSTSFSAAPIAPPPDEQIAAPPLEADGLPLDPETASLLLLPTQRPTEPITRGLSTATTLSSLIDEVLTTALPTPDLLALAEDIKMLGI